MRLFIIILIFYSVNIFSQSANSSEDLLQSLEDDKISALLDQGDGLSDTNELDIIQTESELKALERQNNQTLPLTQEEIEALPFGFSYFLQAPSIDDSLLDIPLQSDYKISFKDEINLRFTGAVNKNYSLKVNLGGEISIPEIGKVSLKDLTLSEAESKISQLVKDSFLGTKISLSIVKASLKKISIIGAVKRPGTYIVNPFISISEAISYAGGLKENASLRNIQISRLNGSIENYDLYKFLIYGDRASDSNLGNGDTLIVNFTPNFFEVEGEVLRPGTYENKPGDTLEDILLFAQGITNKADKKRISLNYIDLNSRKLVTKSNIPETDIVPKSVESVYVGSFVSIPDKDIEIIGEAVSSGYLSKNKTVILLDEIVDSLSFSDNIYPYYAVAEYKSSSGLEKRNFYFSIADPETYQNIELMGNISIRFFSKSEILFNQDILKQQSVIFGDSPSFQEDIIERFDQKSEDISYWIKKDNVLLVQVGQDDFFLPVVGRYKLSNLIVNFNFTGNFAKATEVSQDGARDVLIDEMLVYSKNSYILLPEEKINYIEVSIAGEVEFPGSYLVRSDTTLSDLYRISGSFTSYADIDAIFFSRESVKLREKESYENAKKLILDAIISSLGNPQAGEKTIDPTILTFLDVDIEKFAGRISGDLAPDTEFASNTYLMNGDRVFVPKRTNTVTVTGEVLSPNTVAFSINQDLDYYINQSGGVNSFGDKAKIYLIKSNGQSQAFNSRIFSNNIAKIEPGDTIVVPRDLTKISALPLVQAAASVLSSLAVSAASLNAITN